MVSPAEGMKIFIWRLRADSGLRKDPAPEEGRFNIRL